MRSAIVLLSKQEISGISQPLYDNFRICAVLTFIFISWLRYYKDNIVLDEDKKCTLTLTRAQPLKMAGRKWSRKRERYKTALTDSWTVSLNVRDPWESIARQINPGSLPNASVTTPHARPVAYWSWIGWRETILSTRTFGLGLFYEEKVLGGKVSYIYITHI